VLEHGLVSGKRQIFLNGDSIMKKKRPLDFGTTHKLVLPASQSGDGHPHEMVVKIKMSVGLDAAWGYMFRIDGFPFDVHPANSVGPERDLGSRPQLLLGHGSKGLDRKK
jgi:hypothetical protein